ncbi:hypothetical protein, partial [Salmonella enterica]|uniref:hypothetical protein n=1 Tax=Salmonella enterica TaxID=28901 RepID=UPI001C631D4F
NTERTGKIYPPTGLAKRSILYSTYHALQKVNSKKPSNEGGIIRVEIHRKVMFDNDNHSPQ